MTTARVVLVSRLAVRDLRHRRVEAVLLVLAIVAATTTLTLGLVLRGVSGDAYNATRDATAGPDVVASVAPHPAGGEPADLARLEALADAPAVVGHSGPYPVIGAELATDGRTVPVQAEGRDEAPAAVDQPKLIAGSWIEAGELVVEGDLADALGVQPGDSITLDGRSFRVAGIAVTAAIANGIAPLYSLPRSLGGTDEAPRGPSRRIEVRASGLVWMTGADVRALAGDEQLLAYVVNLRLADPAAAPTFVADHRAGPVGTDAERAPSLYPWQRLLDDASNIVRNEQRALMTGAWLLGLLAVASVAVLVGGRLADQSRRVGLLKAVGGTPGLVAAVLLAEYVVVALVAAALGLAIGRLIAPLLIDPSAGLLGGAGNPALTLTTVVIVAAAAVAVAIAATLMPAMRASRRSTVDALAGSVRPPRRSTRLIALSARVPIPLLLALRVAARRPRRIVLGIASVAVTVSGIVAVLAAHAQLAEQTGPVTSAFDELRADRLQSVLLVITVMLVALAAVNAVFIAWATVIDTKQVSALARALGTTPLEVSAGLCAAQALPALAGAVLGIPGGLALFAAVTPDAAPTPALPLLVALIPATVGAVAVLTAVPARLAARQPIAEALTTEHS